MGCGLLTVHQDYPKDSQYKKNKNQWVSIHYMVSTKRDLRNWKHWKTTALHMQARSWTGLESAVWEQGGFLQAVCLQGNGAEQQEPKQSCHSRGKEVITAQHLPRTVSLRALGTHPGEKKKHKSQGTDTYPGSSFTAGDGITQPDNREGRRIKAHWNQFFLASDLRQPFTPVRSKNKMLFCWPGNASLGIGLGLRGGKRQEAAPCIWDIGSYKYIIYRFSLKQPFCFTIALNKLPQQFKAGQAPAHNHYKSFITIFCKS